ncbi:MAG: hypothetical protein ACTS3F_00875, partial [Phycisphaerales bacterium]
MPIPHTATTHPIPQSRTTTSPLSGIHAPIPIPLRVLNAHGPILHTTIPARGMQRIPEQIAAA